MTHAYVIDACGECAVENGRICYHPAHFKNEIGARAIPDLESVPSWCPLLEEPLWLELSIKVKREKASE